MRVMVLTDASFALREHQLLTRLEIGLADDGASLLHAAPVRCAVDVASAFSSTLLRYDDTPAPFGRAARARHLLKSAAEQLDDAEMKLDLVHVCGSRAWALGWEVASACGARLVLEVWHARLVDEALRMAHAVTRRREGGAVGLLTSSEKIGAELREGERAGLRVRVGVAPWGIGHVETVRPPIDRTRGVAMSVLATGHDTPELRRMFEGVQRAARRVENLLLFLDGTAADRAPVWRAARRLGLLDRVTAVAEMEARREPILQTDILALPEAEGACRTLALGAMAEGLAVVARPDAYHAGWLNPATARLVGSAGAPATAQEWEQAIVACVEDEAGTTALRQGARMLMRTQRTLAAYVEGVRRLYDDVLSVGRAEAVGTVASPG